MRKSEAAAAVATAVALHFPDDVASVIKADQNMYERVIDRLGEDCADAAEVTKVLGWVAEKTEDRTKDWLVDDADSPAGWLYSKIRDL